MSLTNSYALGDHTVLFAASDGQLAVSCAMAVRVVDNTPPTLTVPANIAVPHRSRQAHGHRHLQGHGHDDFPGEPNVVCLPLPGSAFRSV